MERTWEQANHEQLQALGQRLDVLVRQQAETQATLGQIKNAAWLLVVVLTVVGLVAFAILNRL